MMRFFEDPQNTSKNRQKERCYYIPGGVSEYHSMNGEWRFAYFSRDIDVPEKVSEWNKISVPSCWQTEGFENPNYTNINYPYPCDPPYVPDDDPVGVYEREFTLNKWGKVYYIFEGVSSLAVLYINGIFAGFTQGSHLQAEFDITDLVINGKNTVRVHVYKWCAGSYLESQDFFRMNGIFRDTYILQRPFDHIFDFTVRTTEKAVIVECDKQADILLYDAKGQLLASEENAVCTHLRVEDPVFWNAEEPYLYSLKISRNGETIEEKTAFRTIGISSEGELLINERPVKLHGVNRHDTHPKTGWSMTEDEMRDELLLMKRLNINCIRTAHYPPAPKLLSMCDEMGFYVILETDIETHGFLRRNANVPYRYDYESGEWPTSLPQWRDEFISRMKRA
ncbi:MAG: glycoside hydrolase family 2, partial [Ruminococcaceae bacterium]|nr:glycoside hydrolase family 2 [Oscillospiraceae bacterium]